MPKESSRRARRAVSILVPLLVAAVAVVLSVDGGGRGSGADGPAIASTAVARSTSIPDSVAVSVLGTSTSVGRASTSVATTDGFDPSECVGEPHDSVSLDELPDEALVTFALIDRGGPFPYDQDGAVFQNREGELPKHERGYYHEYTVETPGSDDRGARRIVTGDCGDEWFTDDHYDSFALVVGR